VRLHGWCTGCRKVKLVRVSGHGLAMAAATKGVASGICAQCEDEETKRRKEGR